MRTSKLLAFLRMDIEEVRRANLRAESKRVGGDADLARLLGADKNQVYQWLRAEGKQRRNMRTTTAREAEIKLGRERGWLDVQHDVIHAPAAEVLASRPTNNVKALRFALDGLFSVLHEKMPDVAEAVAQNIVETAGTEFARQGFLNMLLGNLRGAEHMSAEERLVPRPVQASPTLKRVVSAAKKT